MIRIASLADKIATEAEMPVEGRWRARTLYEQLQETAGRHPGRGAIAFQLQSGPKDKLAALDWSELLGQVTRLANLLRRLGVGPGDTVAFILPNGLEAVIALLAGATAGIVAPINPLQSPARLGALLAETQAKVVITLAPFPKTDLAQRVDSALAHAPGVETVLEVDLSAYLPMPKNWIAPFLRPKLRDRPRVQRLDFRKAISGERSSALGFAE